MSPRDSPAGTKGTACAWPADLNCFIELRSVAARRAERPNQSPNLVTIEEVGFAVDSLLEESGFELPVPLLRKRVPGVAEGRCWTDRLGGAPPNRGARALPRLSALAGLSHH